MKEQYQNVTAKIKLRLKKIKKSKYSLKEKLIIDLRKKKNFEVYTVKKKMNKNDV